MGVAKTTLSTASAALQKRGLIQKLSDPDDGRAHFLALTVEGAEIANAIYQQDLSNMKLLLEQLDQKDHGHLLDQLETVVSGLIGEMRSS